MPQIYKRVRVALVIFLAIITLIIFFGVYNPMTNQLIAEVNNNYKLSATDKIQVINANLLKATNHVASVASRTEIKKRLAWYLDGEISFEELREYTTPRYLDGIKTYDQVNSAARVTINNEIVTIYGPNENIAKLINWSETDRYASIYPEEEIVVVQAAIMEGQEVLGYDIISVNLGLVKEELEQEGYTITFLEEKLEDNVIIEDDLISAYIYCKVARGTFKVSTFKADVYGPVNDLTKQISIIYFTILVIIYLIIQFFLVRYVEKIIKREQDLKQSVFLEKERLQATILSIEEGFIATDINGKITMINESAKRLLNVKSRQIIGKDVNNIFDLYRIENNEKFDILEDFFIKEHMDIDNEEPAILKTEEKDMFIRLNISQIKLDNQKVMGYVIILSDITEEINEQERIKHLSFHDELTGLYNRREINRRIEEFDREEYLPLTVISMDLNNLKVANDLFGHNTGDELIKETANLLRSVFRDDDVVARVGGDEFSAILPKTSSFEAMKIISRIKKASTSFKVEPLWVSLAVGNATKVDVSQEIFKVINDADTKMYEDKQRNEDINRKKLIEALMEYNFKRIPFEYNHSIEVAKLSAKLYESLGKDEKKVSDLFEVAKIHDIGKAVLDEKILNVDRKLTKNEYSYIKRHSEVGYQLLHDIGFKNPYLLTILYHHERVDGEGYPERLMGYEIPLEAKVISIADAYEAMTSARPYKRAFSQEEAISELRKNACTQFDSKLVEIFINQVLSKTE